MRATSHVRDVFAQLRSLPGPFAGRVIERLQGIGSISVVTNHLLLVHEYGHILLDNMLVKQLLLILAIGMLINGGLPLMVAGLLRLQRGRRRRMPAVLFRIDCVPRVVAHTQVLRVHLAARLTVSRVDSLF